MLQLFHGYFGHRAGSGKMEKGLGKGDHPKLDTPNERNCFSNSLVSIQDISQVNNALLNYLIIIIE